MEVSTQTDILSFETSKNVSPKLVEPPKARSIQKSHIRIYQPEDGSVYYKIDDKTCLKIHVYQNKVYFDVRRYRLTEDGKIDVNLFKPEAGKIPGLFPFQKTRTDEVIRGRGISLTTHQAAIFFENIEFIKEDIEHKK